MSNIGPEIAQAVIALEATLNNAQIDATARKAAAQFNRTFSQATATLNARSKASQTAAAASVAAAFGGIARTATIAVPAVNRLTNSVQQLLRGFTALTGRTLHINQLFRGLTTGAAIAVTSLLALSAAALKLAQTAIQTASQFQELSISINAIIANSNTADITTNKFITSLRELALASGRSSTALANTGRQFLALGFSGGRTLEVLDAFTRAANLTGATNEQLRLALGGVAQIASKGAVAMEELRRQIAENLPGAVNLTVFFEELGKQMGVSTAEARKLQEQGLAPANAGIQALVNTINIATEGIDVFGLRASTLAGQLGIIRELFTQIVQTSFQPFLTAIVPVLRDFSEGLQAGTGPLQDIKDSLSAFATTLGESVGRALTEILPKLPGFIDAFTEISAVMIPIITRMISFAVSITNAVIPVIKLLAGAFKLFTNAVGESISLGLTIASVLKSFGSVLSSIIGRFGRFGRAIAGPLGSLGKFAGIVGAVLAGLNELNVLLGTLRDIWNEQTPIIVASAKMIANAIQSIIDKVPGLRSVITALGVMKDVVVAAASAVRDDLFDDRPAKRWIEVTKAAVSDFSRSVFDVNTALDGILGKLDGFTTAERRLRDANESVADAQRKYNDLLKKGAVDIEEVERAEERLSDARDDTADTLKDLAEAEEDLRLARQPATADELSDAEDELTKAKIALARATREAEEAEDKLNDTQRISLNLRGLSLDQLRSTLSNVRAQLAAQRATKKSNEDAGKSAEELAEDAVLKQISLRDAARDVRDAESELNDIKLKGTEIDEDVIDAREKVLEVQEKLADAVKAEATAQKELTKARAGDVTFSQQLAEANIAIARAKEDQLAAEQELALKRAEAVGDEQAIAVAKLTQVAANKVLILQSPALFRNLLTSLFGAALAPGGAPGVAFQGAIQTALTTILLQPGTDFLAFLKSLGLAANYEGGLITRPTISTLGERGSKELVLNLNKNMAGRSQALLDRHLPAHLRVPGRGYDGMTREQAARMIELLESKEFNGRIEAPIYLTTPVPAIKIAGHLERLNNRRKR